LEESGEAVQNKVCLYM